MNPFLLFCAAMSGAVLLADQPNTLSTAEKKAGWQLLFDGKTLNGWRGYQHKEPKNWKVENGLIHGTNTNQSEAARADLITNAEYDNFELAFEWKVGPLGNSGVMYRATEVHKQPYYSGPEYQLEGYAADYARRGEKLPLTVLQLTGAAYDMYENPLNNARPLGEFNESRILVNGANVEHWLNGKKVLEYELWSDDWKARKAKSKWKAEADYGMAKKGHIAFQDHGTEVWYRSVKLRKL